jgi:hypothetical protein
LRRTNLISDHALGIALSFSDHVRPSICAQATRLNHAVLLL